MSPVTPHSSCCAMVPMYAAWIEHHSPSNGDGAVRSMRVKFSSRTYGGRTLADASICRTALSRKAIRFWPNMYGARLGTSAVCSWPRSSLLPIRDFATPLNTSLRIHRSPA